MGHQKAVLSTIQVKAVFILLLLAGNEAARIVQDINVAQAMLDRVNSSKGNPWWTGSGSSGTKTKYEKLWQKENKACRWSSFSAIRGKGACIGPGCEYRYIPLDRPAPFFSESCRLSDDYMLGSPKRDEFLEIQAGVLAAKAKQFKKSRCGEGGLNSFNPRCARRSRHLMRSIVFLSKAQKEDAAASDPERKAQEQKLIESALAELSDAYGKDGHLVLMLRKRLAAGNGAALLKDPKATVIRTVGLLTALMQGTEDERAVAREAIRMMPEAESDSADATIPLPKDLEEAIRRGTCEGRKTVKAVAEGGKAGEEDTLADACDGSSPTNLEDSMGMDELANHFAATGKLEALKDAFEKESSQLEAEIDKSLTKESAGATRQALLELGNVSLLEEGKRGLNKDTGPDSEDLREFDIRYYEVFDELVDHQGMNETDAEKKAMKIVTYEFDQKSWRPLTVFSYIVLTAVFVFVALFAVLKIVALLTYWLLFSLIGCASYAGIHNLAFTTQEWKNNATKFTGKMTAADIMTCTSKVFWIAIYAPWKTLELVLTTAVDLLFLPFKLGWKGIKYLMKDKEKSQKTAGAAAEKDKEKRRKTAGAAAEKGKEKSQKTAGAAAEKGKEKRQTAEEHALLEFGEKTMAASTNSSGPVSLAEVLGMAKAAASSMA